MVSYWEQVADPEGSERDAQANDDGRRFHPSQSFEGATRRAVEVRDRHCTFEGCEEPAQRCDVDHTVRYEAGGLTVQANGRLRCPPHHPGRRKLRRRPRGPDPPR